MSSSNKTSNYQLNQWSATDQVKRTDFNADNQKIDAALKALDSRAKIATGSYTGSGTYGQSHPNSLNFTSTLGKAPKLLYVAEGDGYYRLLLVHGVGLSTSLDPETAYKNYITWSGATVSWYSPEDQFNQLNGSNRRYYYVALA